MSIIDALNRFAVNEDLYGALEVFIVAEGVIDLKNPRNIGSGDPVFVAVDVNQSFVGGERVTFEVVTADAESDFQTDQVEVIGSATLTVAQLTAGRRFGFYLRPTLKPTGYRYLGLRAITFENNSTAGRVTASIVHQPDEGFLTYYPAVQPFA